jgi:hypothetical protein
MVNVINTSLNQPNVAPINELLILRKFRENRLFELSMADTTSISDLPLDQSTISQLVSGLQQTRGATQLQSRDIPVDTTSVVVDEQTQPNFVPVAVSNSLDKDYIGEYEEEEPHNNNTSLDDLYNEIQTPLLLAVLFFVFQLPIFKKYLFRYFPILFSGDGNLNINGFLFNSALFGLVFYSYKKLMCSIV